MKPPKIIAIVGPTASGKSDLAITLAKAVKGEIVSADSRQLYKGMDVAAAIEPGDWRGRGAARTYVARGVAHHLTACFPPDLPLTLAEYQRSAFAAIDGILARGKTPILVGGTGLYIRAVIENYAIPEVPPDPAVRSRLERLSTGRLYAMVRRRDPKYAARIPQGNRRYAIRALEVMETTDKPFSELQRRGRPKYRVLMLEPKIERDALYRRIDRRVDAMVGAGLLREAKRLVRRHGWATPAMSALGYGQLRGAIEGKEPLETGIERLKRDTRRYAKRQLTWFRKDRRIRRITSPQDALRLARHFLDRL